MLALLRFAPYALSGALVAAVWWLWVDRARQEAERAALARELAIQTRVAEQAELARDVADAEAERVSAKAREYDALKEALMRGEDNAELPDWFVAYLGRLFADDQD